MTADYGRLTAGKDQRSKKKEKDKGNSDHNWVWDSTSLPTPPRLRFAEPPLLEKEGKFSVRWLVLNDLVRFITDDCYIDLSPLPRGTAGPLFGTAGGAFYKPPFPFFWFLFLILSFQISPMSASTCLNFSLLAGFKGTIGSRYDSWMSPIMVNAAFTGIGLVSMKLIFNKG